MKGISRSPSRKVRKFVNELIHQLDRSCAQLVVLNKDERAFQHVDILFKDKSTGEQISVSTYLEKAKLIQTVESSRNTCVYDFGLFLTISFNIYSYDNDKEKKFNSKKVQKNNFKSDAPKIRCN